MILGEPRGRDFQQRSKGGEVETRNQRAINATDEKKIKIRSSENVLCYYANLMAHTPPIPELLEMLARRQKTEHAVEPLWMDSCREIYI